MPSTVRPRWGRIAVVVSAITLSVGSGLAASPVSAAATPATATTPSAAKPPVSPRLAAAVGPERRSSPDSSAPIGAPGAVLRDRTGRLIVDITVDDGGRRSFPAVEALGADVIATDTGRVRATIAVPTDVVARLSVAPGVRYVAEVAPPVRADAAPIAPRAPISNAACSDRVISEADTQLQAATARSTFSVDGSGVRVGIVSDSYDALGGASGDISDGELPGAGNPCGRTTPVVVQSDVATIGSIDEGRAMAQLVHDLAPGAELAVATASFGELDMAEQIRTLGRRGADVITDDILWLSEPLFQEGPVAVAIRENRIDRDIPHFTSAGNSNVILDGKDVASYETPAFRPTACPAAVSALDPGYSACHDFAPGGGTDAGHRISLANGGYVDLLLGWSEPLNGVTTDLDLFLVDVATNVVIPPGDSGGILDSPAVGIPNEPFSFTNTSGGPRQYDIVVARYDGPESSPGTPRFRHAFVRSGGLTSVEYDTSDGGDVVGPTLLGHAAAAPAMSVAAVPYSDSSVVEPFSSRGPALTCWAPYRGAPPSTALSPCTVADVDVAATDGAATSFFGTPDGGTFRFFGTSAAAPHAAAVAALLRDRRPCASASEVESALTSTAASVGALGTAEVGAGLVDAADATGAIGAGDDCPTPPTSEPVVESLTPQRFADSRDEPTFDGAFRSTGRRAADSTWEIDVGGRGGVPADASGAVVNVTIVNGEAPGFATVYPCGSRPLASSLNYVPGGLEANELVAKLSSTGTLCIYTFAGADVIVDVVGYLPAASPYVPLSPLRFADSRAEPTFDDSQRNTGPRRADTVWEIPIAGRGSIPDDATTVVANVTVTNGQAEGFATIYPCGTRPLTSSLNYAPGITRPNEVIAKLSPAGTICIYTFATADIIVDVVGHLAETPDFTSITPLRFADSRDEPTFDDGQRNTGPRRADTVWEIPIAGRGSIPDDATTVVANVTVTNGQAEGFATIYPCGTRPLTSSLNYAPGITRPNEVIAKLSPAGTICIYTFATADIIVDVAGHD